MFLIYFSNGRNVFQLCELMSFAGFFTGSVCMAEFCFFSANEFLLHAGADLVLHSAQSIWESTKLKLTMFKIKAQGN